MMKTLILLSVTAVSLQMAYATVGRPNLTPSQAPIMDSTEVQPLTASQKANVLALQKMIADNSAAKSAKQKSSNQ